MRFASSSVVSMEGFALAFPGPLACATKKMARGLKRNQGSGAGCAPPVCADSIPARQILPAQSVRNQRHVVSESFLKGGQS
jgi:hypothetical protein